LEMVAGFDGFLRYRLRSMRALNVALWPETEVPERPRFGR
jgi:hypothetical protein